jgi:predicted AlkP superfamily pyrophosphatase or phosphodiesterase
MLQSPRRLLALALGISAALAGSVAPARPAAHHKPAARAAAPVAAPSGPPKLLVAIAVDQFSADLFAQYRQHYTAGMARLLQGAVFPSAFQSHSATETCPGHSTLLTGVHPGRSGIIANNWYDTSLKREDKRVYCAEDESNPNGDSKSPVVSAGHLKVPTLGERMKAQWPESRNVAVSAKDRAVMMMGGHQIDEAYWWVGRGFSTLDGRSLAPAALAENAAMIRLLASGAPGFVPPAFCAARARDISTGPLAPDVVTGPVVVGTGTFAVEPDQGDDIRVSPRVDAATLDLAARLVADMKLGKGAAPDMLSISLSATDYVGHAYGTEGLEMCIQQVELDKALGAFFARLDAMGIDYAVMLTADHGGLDVPERLDQQAAPKARRADIALTAYGVSADLQDKLHIDPAVLAKLPQCSYRNPLPVSVTPTRLDLAPPLVCAESAFGDYYVNKMLPDPLRARVIATLVDILRASPDVELVLTKPEIEKIHYPIGDPQDWSIPERIRASYDPERTGDVFTVLHRTVVPIPVVRPGYTATHGSPWDYDRRVPLLFWRAGVPGFEQPQPVETVDIAPSFAALIGLKYPQGSFDGRCLDIDGGPKDTCLGPK